MEEDPPPFSEGAFIKTMLPSFLFPPHLSRIPPLPLFEMGWVLRFKADVALPIRPSWPCLILSLSPEDHHSFFFCSTRWSLHKSLSPRPRVSMMSSHLFHEEQKDSALPFPNLHLEAKSSPDRPSPFFWIVPWTGRDDTPIDAMVFAPQGRSSFFPPPVSFSFIGSARTSPSGEIDLEVLGAAKFSPTRVRLSPYFPRTGPNPFKRSFPPAALSLFRSLLHLDIEALI